MRFDDGYRLALVLDPDGTIRDVVEVTGVEGFRRDTFLGHFVGDVAAGGVRGAARRQVWVDRLASARAQPHPIRYDDLRPDHPEGSPPVVSTSITPITGRDGSLEAILVAVQDLTPVHRIERTVREQREQLQTALDVAGLGSCVHYLREPRFDADERYVDIVGLDPQELISEQGFGAYLQLVHEDDREKVAAAIRASGWEPGVPHQIEYRWWRPRRGGDSELRRIKAIGRAEFDDQGPVRIYGVVDDVTDRRRADELRVRMQKREALGTLAGGMAHDFNNVISAILSNAAVAEAEIQAGDSPATSLEEIRRGAERAGELVRRMLDFSRDREPERVPFSLGAVAQDAAALMRASLPRGASLEVRVLGGLPAMLGDASQLHQVVVNLIANAGQALVGGTGEIEVVVDAVAVCESGSGSVATLPAGDYLRLRVRDDGRGVPEHLIPRIFDPFFTTKTRAEGTGLGLAAAQSIVRSHGGQIAVDSLPGDGTTVTVHLPIGEPGHRAPSRAARAAPPATPVTADEPRVLFVDDEPALALLAERGLPHHGCRPVAFSDPAAALDRLRADPSAVDVLVTDLAMPGMTGLELIAAARALRPDLPVVLTSGFLTDESEAEAARIGVDVVVPKPCPIDALAEACLRLTRADGA